METYCVKCRKHTENKNLNVRKTKHNRLMLLQNCAVCRIFFLKNKELHNFD